MAGAGYVVPALHPAVTTVAPGDDGYDARNRHKSTLYKLGITEIVLGCGAVVFAIASIIDVASDTSYRYDSDVVYVAPGIWCGVFPIISGGLGVCTRKSPSVCMFNANMVMSIMSAIFMATLFACSVTFAIISIGYPLVVIFQSLCAVGSFTAMIINIVHSAYCCAGVCCKKRRVAYATTPHVAPGQQFVRLPNGQYAFVQMQAQPFLAQNYQVTSIPGAGVATAVQPQSSHMARPVTPAQYPQQMMNDPYKQVAAPQPFQAQQALPANPPAYEAPGYPGPTPVSM